MDLSTFPGFIHIIPRIIWGENGFIHILSWIYPYYILDFIHILPEFDPYFIPADRHFTPDSNSLSFTDYALLIKSKNLKYYNIILHIKEQAESKRQKKLNK